MDGESSQTGHDAVPGPGGARSPEEAPGPWGTHAPSEPGPAETAPGAATHPGAAAPGSGRGRGATAVMGVWSAQLGRTMVRTLLLVLGLALVVAAGYVLWKLRIVVIPLVIALLLAAAFSPLVRWLHRRRVPKTLATWIALLTAVVVVGGVITGVVAAVASQWNQLVSSSNQGFLRLERLAADGPLPFTTEQLRQAREIAADYISQRLSVGNAFSALSLLTTLVVGLLLTAVMLFFFLKDGGSMYRFLLGPLDSRRRDKALYAGGRALDAMGGYVRGVTLVALIDAVAIGVVLLVLGVPLAVPLAVIVFLGAYVPVVGATLSGIFAVLVTFVTNGAQDALIVAVAVVVVQQLEGNLLLPLIMGQVLDLHPLVVLIALTAGGVLAGIAGAVLAVPLTAVAWTIAKAWQREPDPDRPAPSHLAPH